MQAYSRPFVICEEYPQSGQRRIGKTY